MKNFLRATFLTVLVFGGWVTSIMAATDLYAIHDQYGDGSWDFSAEAFPTIITIVTVGYGVTDGSYSVGVIDSQGNNGSVSFSVSNHVAIVSSVAIDFVNGTGSVRYTRSELLSSNGYPPPKTTIYTVQGAGNTGTFTLTGSIVTRTVWPQAPVTSLTAQTATFNIGFQLVPDPNKTKKNDPKTGCPQDSHAMPRYNAHSSVVSLNIEDTPVGYRPPVGPVMDFTVTYNQREANQPAMFPYSNFGSKWTFNWFSYVTDDPNDSTANASVYVRGGGTETYTNFDAASQSYALDLQSHARLVRTSTSSYEKRFPDGSKEVFNLPDGSTTSPRKIFMAQVVDASGNAMTLRYDGSLRVTAITDAIGQQTTLAYEVAADPLKITKVTDPFGRFAKFDYNSDGRLYQITDEIGMASSFVYDVGSDFINTLTTPYGSTTFAKGEDGMNRWLQITDPNGGRERVEYRDQAPGINASDPSAPAGALNAGLQYANTFYWNRKAMMQAPGDYTKAQITHWLYSADGKTITSTAASEKQALENRVWYQYDGQTDLHLSGTNGLPSKANRILDDGTTQAYQFEYNALGKYTRTTDPLGRSISFVYDANNVDLLEVRQTTGSNNELLSSATYNAQHLPLTLTDASGRTTSFTYNARGQVLAATNAKNETTTRSFDTNGYLQTITGPVAGSTSSFTYDGYGRVRTATDSQNYTRTQDYDALDRLTVITYPDTTYEQITYDKLDAHLVRDRMGRVTTYNHDALQHVTSVVDPLNRTTAYNWCGCGALDSITDANNRITSWTRDVQSRVLGKTYADSTSIQYVYENTTSRLKKITDAKGQATNYSYYLDNDLQQVSYTDSSGQPLNPPTPGVSYTYDPNYNRVLTMADGTGTTTYSYNAITAPALGSGLLAGIDGPLANDTIGYGYDELGRVLNRSINGAANASSMTYDSLGRISMATNPLGAFNYNYVSVTGRLSSVNYPGGQSTVFSYFDNLGDQRLQEIKNLNPAAAMISQFDYTYNAVGNIPSWTQNNSGLAGAQRYDFSYDAADQLKEAILKNAGSGAEIKPYLYSYDNAGNRTSEQADTNVASSGYNNVNQLTSHTAGGAMRFKGTINEPGTVTISGTAVTVDGGLNFTGYANVTGGTNTVPIVARDTAGNARTNNYQVTVPALNQSPTYDLNGNLTGDGTKTYEWDAVNRLTAINSGTYRTEFSYDGQSRRVKIVEKDNGNVTSTKNLLWCGMEICEERDGGNTVTKRYYVQGMQIGVNNYFYTRDHLGTIRELTDNSGVVHARYDYDPYGRRSANLITTNAVEADFGFTGHYYHASSSLHLAPYRAYSADLGRWLSRDPIGENGGLNLYGYVGNDPANGIDPLGLRVNWAGVFKSTKNMIDTMRKQDPVFDKQIAQLDASPNPWNITTQPYDVTHMNVKPANEADRCNGKGTGGTINIVPPGGSIKTPDGTFTAQEVAAHETQHAVDIDNGTLDIVGKVLNNGWMIPNWGAEVRAVDAQNRYDQAIGSSNVRTKYGGILVH